MTTTLTAPEPSIPGVDRADSRAVLMGLYLELSAEIDDVEQAGQALDAMADRGRGDEADSGARAAEREQRVTLLANIRQRRDQVEHALARIDVGGYGRCEGCDEPIATERLDAFPSATTCMPCKHAEERRR